LWWVLQSSVVNKAEAGVVERERATTAAKAAGSAAVWDPHNPWSTATLAIAIAFDNTLSMSNK
jgi:hypothetical protein